MCIFLRLFSPFLLLILFVLSLNVVCRANFQIFFLFAVRRLFDDDDEKKTDEKKYNASANLHLSLHLIFIILWMCGLRRSNVWGQKKPREYQIYVKNVEKIFTPLFLSTSLACMRRNREFKFYVWNSKFELFRFYWNLSNDKNTITSFGNQTFKNVRSDDE